MRALTSVVAALVGACAAPGAYDTRNVEVTDLDGHALHPLDAGDARASVLFFVTTDCPIANGYAPEIRAIVAEHAGAAFRFFLVHVDADVTVEAARKHAREFGHAGVSIVIDRAHDLVRATGVTVTPEVAIVTRGGALAYRGRIDDRVTDLGASRPAATRRDLRDALAAVLAGRACDPARTAAIGCDVPQLPTQR